LGRDIARLQQPALLLLLAAMAVWWSSLRVDPLAGLAPHAGTGAGVFALRWWSWIFQLQLGLTAVLIVAAVLQDIRYRSRRRRAWPDRLDDLMELYSRWPFFIRMEAIIAAVVLVLGVYQIIQFAPPGWPLSIAGGLVCAAAGAVCVFMTYRRWSANTAGLGLSLLSLSAVFVSCAVTAVTVAPRDATEYAERIPTLFNAVLFALALMIAWWRWLANVWQQQLLGDIPWTTAGRMIPYNRHFRFFFQRLWPCCWPSKWQRGPTSSRPATPTVSRSDVCGLAAIGLLAGMTIQFGAPTPIEYERLARHGAGYRRNRLPLHSHARAGLERMDHSIFRGRVGRLGPSVIVDGGIARRGTLALPRTAALAPGLTRFAGRGPRTIVITGAPARRMGQAGDDCDARPRLWACRPSRTSPGVPCAGCGLVHCIVHNVV
jgi:hypothetical protein